MRFLPNCYATSIGMALLSVLSVGPIHGEMKVFVGAKIIPIGGGDEIADGVLIVDGKKIVDVGAADQVEIPDGAERIELAGKVVMPGLICTHSHIGGIGGADGSGPIQPGVRVYESLNVRDSGFKRALAGGLTHLVTLTHCGFSHLVTFTHAWVVARCV